MDAEAEDSAISKHEWAEGLDRPARGRSPRIADHQVETNRDTPKVLGHRGGTNPPQITSRPDPKDKRPLRPKIPARSIYQSKQRPLARQAGYFAWLAKHGNVRDYIHDRIVTVSDVCHTTARVRGAAHPQCFTDEVILHQFLKGFKPINID